MRKTLFISLLVVLFGSVSSIASANLLTNPGFETGDLSNWTPWSSNYTMNDWGHNGSNYSVSTWWWAGGWQTVSISDPDVLTTVGGWIYDDVAGGEPLQGGVYAQIKVEFKNASDGIVGVWLTGPLTGANLTDNAWNDYTAQVTPSSYGSGITKAALVWEVNNSGSGSGRGIFDDMILEPVPEPGTIILLSSGILGLIPFYYRKRTR